jgi:hypothetical protein
LAAAFGAITASAILKIVGKDDWALFVGQWSSGISVNGRLQQNGKAARLGCIQQGCLRNHVTGVASETEGTSGPRAVLKLPSIQPKENQ